MDPNAAIANRVDTSAIPGWSVDADPDNDPTYPMRDRSKDDGPGMNWTRPSLQPERVEVLRSIEHPRLPAVFGTSTPPRGLSGVLRRRAFKYSESNWGHWLILLAADRINVVEGIFQDFGRGRIPNIFAEMGMRAELRHNKAGFIRKLAVAAGLLVLIIVLIAALD